MTMQIRNQKIAGFSAVKVRNALQVIGSGGIFEASSFFAEKLRVSNVERLIEEMADMGLIERAEAPRRRTGKGLSWYSITEKGRSFAAASGMTRMSRASAEALVEPLLRRIDEVNADSAPYTYFVARAAIFGSFLRKTEQTLGDLDVAIELRSRYSDEDKRQEADDERIRVAEEQGRRFSNIVKRYYWPQEEVLRHLKAGQRHLSIHSMSELFSLARHNKAAVPHRVLLGDPIVFPQE